MRGSHIERCDAERRSTFRRRSAPCATRVITAGTPTARLQHNAPEAAKERNRACVGLPRCGCHAPMHSAYPRAEHQHRSAQHASYHAKNSCLRSTCRGSGSNSKASAFVERPIPWSRAQMQIVYIQVPPHLVGIRTAPPPAAVSVTRHASTCPAAPVRSLIDEWSTRLRDLPVSFPAAWVSTGTTAGVISEWAYLGCHVRKRHASTARDTYTRRCGPRTLRLSKSPVSSRCGPHIKTADRRVRSAVAPAIARAQRHLLESRRGAALVRTQAASSACAHLLARIASNK